MSQAAAPNPFDERLYVLKTRWERYRADGQFEHFIEFTIAVNSLVEQFNRMRLPGLARICQGLENEALSCLGSQTTHPVSEQIASALQRQLDTLLGAVSSSRLPVPERRIEERPAETDTEWTKQRAVWIISAPETSHAAKALSQQLQFFGFQIHLSGWDCAKPTAEAPIAVLFIPRPNDPIEAQQESITAVRAACPASQIVYLNAKTEIETIVALMRAGVDVTLPAEEGSSAVLNCILDLVQNIEQEKYRVLVVEDSRVAVALIQRTLAEHGIDSHAIRDPGSLLEELESYRPDLILMDMYMPRFNGVEATRVLRQMPAYNALPIVYLSGESDVGMQVEALRLGGDQFLIKPFNPVLLAATVKTKVERFRGSQRSSRLDGLTGLLNHTTVKSRLKQMVERATPHRPLSVIMIDIDHFKAVNDTFGHPVGDQVIRGLAWLLKGRLRSTDLIGRYGGEEFLLALSDVTPERARTVIDRIREDFSALPHAHANGALYASFSAGLASFPGLDSAQALTEAADAALLEAKRNGRNRVEFAKQPEAAL